MESLNPFASSKTPETPAAGFDVRRQELTPTVRSYVDTLYVQIRQIFDKYGVANIEDLRDGVKSKQIKMEKADVERLIELTRWLRDTLKERKIADPSYMGSYYYPDEMESVVEKIDYREVESFPVGSIVLKLQVLPDGRVLTACGDNSIRIWTKQDGGKWRYETVGKHQKTLRDVQALPDGRIVSGGDFEAVKVWSPLPGGGWGVESIGDDRNDGNRFQALKDGRIVTCSSNGHLNVWTRGPKGIWEDKLVGKEENMFSSSGHSALLALLDGRIVTGAVHGSVCIWTEQPDGKWKKKDLGRHSSFVRYIKMLPDGRLVSTGDDASIRLWTEQADGKWEEKSTLMEQCWGTLQVLPNGRMIMSNPVGNTLSFWSSQTNEKLIGTHAGTVGTAQMLPDGRIFSGGTDRTVRIWDGKPVKE